MAWALYIKKKNDRRQNLVELEKLVLDYLKDFRKPSDLYNRDSAVIDLFQKYGKEFLKPD